VKAQVGIDAVRQKRYEALQRAIATNSNALRGFDANIKNAEGADGRRKELLKSRRDAYKSVFESFVEQREALETLYAPLQEQITGAKGALGKLSFVVRREVDF